MIFFKTSLNVQGKRERDTLPRLVEEPHRVKKVAYCRLCTTEGTLQVYIIIFRRLSFDQSVSRIFFVGLL